jgi:hypothetical protein
VVLMVASACGSATPAFAQQSDAPKISVGMEIERDRLMYHFTNPSAFDSATLVPHFFEQRYETANAWMLADARYVRAIRWRTTAGITLPHTATGDDYDTFFNPDGSVIVSGTTGDVRMQSFRVAQLGDLVRIGALRVSAGYRFRLDRADFGIGHKTVARDAAVVEAFDVGTREMTSSQMHEFLAAASASHTAGPRWSVRLDADASPATLARLLVQLPDKYPGQDLVFLARAATARAQIGAIRAGRWPFELGLMVSHAWGYGETDSISRSTVAVRVAVGLGR